MPGYGTEDPVSHYLKCLCLAKTSKKCRISHSSFPNKNNMNELHEQGVLLDFKLIRSLRDHILMEDRKVDLVLEQSLPFLIGKRTKIFIGSLAV